MCKEYKLDVKDIDFKAAAIAVTRELATTPLHVALKKRIVYKTSDGINVIHWSDAAHTMGVVVAGAATFNMVGGGHTKPVIVIDDMFMNIPPSIQKWIIYHETGHIMNNDLSESNCDNMMLSNYFRPLLNCIGVTTPQEIAADKYATMRTGVITAMRALDFLQREFSAFHIKLEMVTRKRHVMALTK